MKRRSLSRYLALVLSLSSISLLSIAGINVLEDPYAIRCLERDSLLNASRADRAMHAHQLACRQPRRVLLGTSRAVHGLRASHWAPDAYNTALSGATLHEMRRYLEHASAVAPVEEAVVMLDLASIINPAQVRSGFSERRLINRDARIPDAWTLPLDSLSTFLSLATLRSTIKLNWYRHKHLKGGISYNLQGDALDHGGRLITPTPPGLASSMAAHETEYAISLWRKYTVRPAAEKEQIYQRSMDDLRAIIVFARRSDIRLTLAFSPTHAWHSHVLALAGLWELQGRIRRDVVAAVGGGEAIEIFDFQSFSDVSDELVPSDANGKMKWWYDGGHYRPEVGDRILAALLGRDDPLPHERLTPSTVEPAVNRARLAYAEWVATRPIEAQRVEAIYAVARSTPRD